MTSTRTAVVALFALAAFTAACSDSQQITSRAGTTPIDSTVTTGNGGSVVSSSGSTTTAPGTVETSATTTPSVTAAPTTASPGSTAPPTSTSGTCDGAGGIPAGASVGTTIHGDIDGDTHNDTVTEYSLGGVPHVHAKLFTGGQSDAEVQIGNADHVQISFEDFDHSLGAATPPPVAVLAIGATSAGSAVFTFLTLTTHYCIKPWHVSNGSMFVGRISQQGPYSGLMCDGAAGHVYYSLTSAEPASGGGFTVTTQLMHHNFTLVTLDAPQSSHSTDSEATIKAQYGDFSNCNHAPLF